MLNNAEDCDEVLTTFQVYTYLGIATEALKIANKRLRGLPTSIFNVSEAVSKVPGLTLLS